LLVLDEGLGVVLAAGADRSDLSPGGEDILVSIANLTGPLTAGQSSKVAQEKQDLRLLHPEVTEPLFGPVRIDEDLIGKLAGVERHVSPSCPGSHRSPGYAKSGYGER
jgi:hypothetical protein